MRIAIVEDDEKDMAHLRGVVGAYAEGRGMPTEIDTFSSGEDFLRSFAPKKYELIFFDNYIGNGLGIDFARKVRSMDEEAEFVFVSMSPEFAVAGFEVRALHYLIKPATSDGVAKVFERLWEHAPKPESPMVEVMSGRQPVLLPVSSVRYIEVADKTCVVHGDEDVHVYMRLDPLLELFPPNELVRTHKSYAVRLGAIKAMGQKEFLLKSGETVPIGRAYHNDCKSAFIEYLANQRGGK